MSWKKLLASGEVTTHRTSKQELDSIDDHSQCNKYDSRPHGQARGMYWHMRLVTLHLAQEQSETRNGEPNAHQAQAGPYPCKKSSLGSEVDSWISFSLCWIRY